MVVDRGPLGAMVRVAQQDSAQDSLLLQLGVARGNRATDLLKFGESLGHSAKPIPSQAPAGPRRGKV
jgi:hypothetical protein